MFRYDLKLSLHQLKNVKTMTTLALLSALYVVLHLFCTIPISSFVQVRFSFLSVVLAGLLFGPVGGAVVGVTGDLLSFLMRPTGPFFPGFTLNALLTGVIYGLLLHQVWGPFAKRLGRVIVAKLVIVILVELLLTPLWLYLMFSEAYFVVLQGRLLKTIIFVPIDIFLIMGLMRLLPKEIQTMYQQPLPK